ncbi:hypothetical protein [Pseudomonas arsenicoxydans]|uniref:hypothetical protein n=1 Tax=Pseudomonas arsenicoxydans TaxID=702115 RepID=UPI00137627EF|nr:hypothetical protein [Pseudomonas arsenicoxydans]
MASLIASGTGFVQVQRFAQAMRRALEVHPEVQAGVNSRLGADYRLMTANWGYFPSGDLLGGNCYGDTDSVTTRTASTHNHRKILLRRRRASASRQWLLTVFRRAANGCVNKPPRSETFSYLLNTDSRRP